MLLWRDNRDTEIISVAFSAYPAASQLSEFPPTPTQSKWLLFLGNKDSVLGIPTTCAHSLHPPLLFSNQ